MVLVSFFQIKFIAVVKSLFDDKSESSQIVETVGANRVKEVQINLDCIATVNLKYSYT